jgi:sulfite exporter TauE/SafE
MNWPTLLLAGLVLGLAHAAHCAGMCGVFALHAGRRRWGFSAYALGKACTYAVLGALAGVAGATLHALAHPLVPLFGAAVGVILLLGGWRLLRGRDATPGGRVAVAISRVVGNLTSRELPGGRFTLGALTGALPCGAVALALVQASLAGDALRGSALMLAFGLGTVPALLGVALLAAPARARFSPDALRNAGAVLVMLAGVTTIFRSALPLVSDTVTCCP